MIDLKNYKPKPHPLRKVFKKHKIRQVVLAQALETHESLLSRWLCGHVPPPEDIEQKLNECARQLEGDY